ncbi:MAG: NAD-dependent epimerase/dehydratase family protein [Acidobacteriota bacterium]
MSRTVAITGATGFIGRHLTADLLARGFEVRAVVRPDSPHEAPAGAVPVRATLDAAALRDAFGGVDTVVHLAGIISALRPDSYSTVNVAGTQAVAQAAHAASAQLIHVSSLAAAGPAPAASPRREDDPPSPQTPYGRSKLAGEQAVTGMPGLRWTILRPGVVYGPGDRAMLPLFKLAERGLLPLVGRPDAAYTFVHIQDVVRTIAAAIEAAAAGEVMFVGHPRPVSAREILEAIQLAVGRPARVIRVPQAITRLAAAGCDLLAPAIGRPLPLTRWRYVELSAAGFVCDVSRLRDRLGIVARLDLRAGLADTAAGYRRAGWIRP